MKEEAIVTQIAQRLLDEARAELTRADDKASSVLSAVGALIAVVAVAPHGAQPGRTIATWGWGCGLSICVLAYFGDVSRVRHAQDLEDLLMQRARRPREAILSELREISRIIVIKYRFTRFGIMCAITGGALLIMSSG